MGRPLRRRLSECPSCKSRLYASRAGHLSACLFHVSTCGAIIAAATANSRRLSQQNPYKTCVSLVELGRTSRHFRVHFKKIPTKIIRRYGRCADRAYIRCRTGTCLHSGLDASSCKLNSCHILRSTYVQRGLVQCNLVVMVTFTVSYCTFNRCWLESLELKAACLLLRSTSLL